MQIHADFVSDRNPCLPQISFFSPLPAQVVLLKLLHSLDSCLPPSAFVTCVVLTTYVTVFEDLANLAPWIPKLQLLQFRLHGPALHRRSRMQLDFSFRSLSPLLLPLDIGGSVTLALSVASPQALRFSVRAALTRVQSDVFHTPLSSAGQRSFLLHASFPQTQSRVPKRDQYLPDKTPT
ncbi:hypothetical protein FQN60_011567 [Etheostoma spectabile]|uniref:Uncharacterized protein n=1 Tax=Etheostoma spectabile TaxID=54343 RepID=A0A5J5DMA5_9PERO|nr:hypothetical protein FQN60_011567 [Etheostoma spectabile]